MNEGQRIMKAWDCWLASDEGEKCRSGATTGQYLKNRLERAYRQGWVDGRIDAKLHEQSAALQQGSEK